MWNKDSQTEVPGTTASRDARLPGANANAPAAPAVNRVAPPAARTLACLGPSIVIKGEITSDEDLQIDGKVDGPIALRGHRLTVGRTAELHSEISAREVVVYGNASGNLKARDRVEIKKDGQVIGDISTSRISIEDGAYFKGHIEIERSNSASQSAKEKEEVPVGATN